ncbi:MAG: glycogen synthase GlgA [Candidatus Zixiibacteriota bacterium]|nr:MAG: glycogen synthase GlgA [candidate division Zixibacteria bacterium]
MRILVVASEAVPFVKTGGLADVVGALPRALARQKHDIKVFIPRYSQFDSGRQQLKPYQWSGAVKVGCRQHTLSVEYVADRRLRLEHYFLKNDHFFSRNGLYHDEARSADYKDNDERFVFFNRGVLETVRQLDWRPDVIHVHDWQAGLIPAYLKILFPDDPFFGGVRTVLTIHNLAFQGTFDKERFGLLGLVEEHFYPTSPFEFFGKTNFLKAGIVYADKITAVSPRYAQEIQTAEHGCGLEGVLRERSADLVGILNGVDYSVWSPTRDKKIPFRFHPANLSGKRMNKVELLRELNLPSREGTPLIGIISRLADQKGFDLLADIADEVLGLNLQVVVLGTGERKYHDLFTRLEQRYPDKLSARLTFDDNLAHRIEAAADMFLMPSRFEPCGLNQMYSLKYGTVPIVREVGGLADTVTDFDPESGQGTGFVFKEYTSAALLGAIKRAVNLYGKRRLWTKIMKSGMKRDFSWDTAARKFADLFRELVER